MSEAAKHRKERLAKQLRANLMKRKAQARERREENSEMTSKKNLKIDDDAQ